MRLKWTLLLLPLFGCLSGLNAQEVRLGAEADYKISKKFKSEFLFQQRFAEHNLQAERSAIVQGKLAYKQNKHFSYALGARYKKEINLETETDHTNNDKYRLTGDVKIKIPEHIKHLSIYNRVRLQQTLSEDNDQWFLVRNQTSVRYKYSKHLSTSLSYELFYNVSNQSLALGRFRFKANHELSKKIAVAAFFTIDSPLKNKKFDHYYIIGAHLTYSI